jgi:hypothetical protein
MGGFEYFFGEIRFVDVKNKGMKHFYCFEGGPDCRAARGPAPEFVHLDDIEGMLKLCRAMMESGLPWDRPWKIQRRLMRKRLQEYRVLLRGFR